MKVKTFAAGEMVFHQGDVPLSITLIDNGGIKIAGWGPLKIISVVISIV